MKMYVFNVSLDDKKKLYLSEHMLATPDIEKAYCFSSLEIANKTKSLLQDVFESVKIEEIEKKPISIITIEKYEDGCSVDYNGSVCDLAFGIHLLARQISIITGDSPIDVLIRAIKIERKVNNGKSF